MTRRNGRPRHDVVTVRCAIYTRKSTEEGLEQEFNSLDAQRDAGEAFIASQQHEGWVCLPDHYDDGGFTGGNMDRPALQRLMADIEAGKIDCVVVYKVDRLSRSLLDFSRMMEAFETHNVSFVSVTQHFNTATSMGRLMLNVLLSFAQFEREIISERTRDKIAATRRKGRWCGGPPILGYDVVEKRLVVNEAEAARVRQIFALYLEYQSLLETANRLNQRGWTTKRWKSKSGKPHGGLTFHKMNLYCLLTNVTYIGKLTYKDEVHDGEHQAIVAPDVFDQVQKLLVRNGRCGGRDVRNKYGALLKYILRCTACDAVMGHAYSVKGDRRYRYYICINAQKSGWDKCPSPSVPAGEIERFVIDQIRAIGRDPTVLSATLREVRRQAEERIQCLQGERARLQRQAGQHLAEINKTAANGAIGEDGVTKLADLQERLRTTQKRLSAIDEEIAALRGQIISETEVAERLANFDAVWEMLAPREQARVIHLLIERVDFDAAEGSVSITFRPTGVRGLGSRFTTNNDEEAAA
jgi:site-specific DNA recombinase